MLNWSLVPSLINGQLIPLFRAKSEGLIITCIQRAYIYFSILASPQLCLALFCVHHRSHIFFLAGGADGSCLSYIRLWPPTSTFWTLLSEATHMGVPQ